MSGWTFSMLSPTALAAALGGAALLTVLLYLLRLRRNQVVVPFIALWEALLLDKKSAALRSQLRRWISLLISLCIISLLVFAFSDPRSPRERRGRHLVVLLDAGTAMKAQIPGLGSSCLEVGKRRVERWLSGLGPGDEMLLVELGARPRALETFTGDRVRLRAALDSMSGLDVLPDLQAALLLARDVLADRTLPEIIVVSNDTLGQHVGGTALSGLPPLRFANLSRECAAKGDVAFAEELRIEAFSARRYPLAPDRFEVLLRVSTAAATSVSAQITISAIQPDGKPGAVLEVVQKELQPGLTESLTFVNLGQADRGLLAHVEHKDGGLERDVGDNWARAVLSTRLPVRVLVVGPVDNFLEAALLIEDSLIVKHFPASAYPPNEEFDITIFNAVAPPRDERTGAALYLGVPADRSHYPVKVGPQIGMFGFDTWDKSSRVFQLIDPYDVQVLTGAVLEPMASDTVLGRSEGKAILVGGAREQGRFLALGFRPQDSDFVLRSAWPLFVVNAIDELYPRGRGDTLATGRAGAEFRVPVVDPEVTSAVLRGPHGEVDTATSVVPVVDGQAVIYSERAGFFDVETKAGTTRIAIAPQLQSISQARQADALAPGTLGPYAVSEPQGMHPKSKFDPWFWLVALVLVASYLEWWSYHRRWTV